MPGEEQDHRSCSGGQSSTCAHRRMEEGAGELRVENDAAAAAVGCCCQMESLGWASCNQIWAGKDRKEPEVGWEIHAAADRPGGCYNHQKRHWDQSAHDHRQGNPRDTQ